MCECTLRLTATKNSEGVGRRSMTYKPEVGELFQLENHTVRNWKRSPVNPYNKLSYRIFCARRGEVDASQLPSCEDCVHVLCPFTCSIHVCNQPGCHPAEISWAFIICPKPNELWFDNTDEDRNLEVEWLPVSPAPDAVMMCYSLSASLTSVCAHVNYISVHPPQHCNDLKWTNMCRLQSSQRKPQEELTDSEVDEDDDVEILCSTYTRIYVEHKTIPRHHLRPHQSLLAAFFFVSLGLVSFHWKGTSPSETNCCL